MNIQFFFIKDHVDSKEIWIEYCPTGDMIADFFTKLLQGRQFYNLQDQVMNVGLSSKYHSDHRSVLREDDGNGTDSDKTQETSKVDPEPDGQDLIVDVEDGSRTNDVARRTMDRR